MFGLDLSTLAGSARDILKIGGKTIDSLFTSDQERKRAKLRLIKQVQKGEFQEEQMELEKQRVARKDRTSARKMYRATRTWLVPTLALLFVTGFFGVLGYMLYAGVPEGTDVMYLLVGQLSAGVASILQFFFGRSDRDDELSEARFGAAPLTPSDPPETGTTESDGSVGTVPAPDPDDLFGNDFTYDDPTHESNNNSGSQQGA